MPRSISGRPTASAARLTGSGAKPPVDFANRSALIRAILPPTTAPLRLSGEIRSNFFCRANQVLRAPRLPAARAAGTLSRGNLRPGTSKFTHRRNGHLTGVFAILQIALV